VNVLELNLDLDNKKPVTQKAQNAQ